MDILVLLTSLTPASTIFRPVSFSSCCFSWTAQGDKSRGGVEYEQWMTKYEAHFSLPEAEQVVSETENDAMDVSA